MDLWLLITIWGLKRKPFPLLIPEIVLVTGINALEILEFSSETVTERAETVTERAETVTERSKTLTELAIALFQQIESSAYYAVCTCLLYTSDAADE